MKTRSMMSVMLAAMLGVCVAAVGNAAQAKNMGQGNGTGTCVHQDLVSGEMVTIAGTVSEMSCNHQGISVVTGTETVQVYGIGPLWYWEDLDMPRPEVGDSIVVIGREITFSDGSTRFVAFSVTIGEDSITLRDAETGLPLWKSGRNGNAQRVQSRECPYFGSTESGT